jgi:hypothetical protein
LENSIIGSFFSQDTMVSSEQLVPNFGGLFGKLDQLKKLGPQNESDVDIPLNDGNTEAPSNRFGLEPMVPSLAKEDADCLSYSSLQTYNLKKQPSYGGKSNMYCFNLFMTTGHVLLEIGLSVVSFKLNK